jgi:D-alanine-D-alanine ligase-like ATP-grasp enzyme
MGVFLVVVLCLLLAGCGDKVYTYENPKQIERLVLGKNHDEVVRILGKPDRTFNSGLLPNGEDDEFWSYPKKVRQKYTGAPVRAKVCFKKGKVVAVIREGD